MLLDNLQNEGDDITTNIKKIKIMAYTVHLDPIWLFNNLS